MAATIRPEAQAIIDRLSNIKFDGSYDEQQIQAALKTYLVALNLPDRPVVVYRSFNQAIAAAAWDAARAAAWAEARDAAWAEARDAAIDAAWAATRDAAWAATRDAAWDAAIANSLYDNPDYEKLKAPFAATSQALENGLFGFWVTPTQVIAVVNPKLSLDDDGRLHSLDDAAVKWEGEEYYYVEGVKVDRQIVLSPETQTIAQINGERNEEVKRIRIAQFGWQRYLTEANATVLDTAIGRWFECLMQVGNITALCTYDPSTGRPYVLEVDPDCKTCAEAQRYLLAPDEALAGTGMAMAIELETYPVVRT
jgi:hypothetical protein